jgi:predicted enzyme related to lactoylglutathione lyase
MSTTETSPKTRGFDFVIYQTTDMRRLRSFYEQLLDLKPTVEYQDFYVEYDLPDGNTFAIGRDPAATEFVPAGGIVFGVTDAEGLGRRVQELGGMYVKRFGEGDPCFSEWCMDPDGNVFGLHQRKSG